MLQVKLLSQNPKKPKYNYNCSSVAGYHSVRGLGLVLSSLISCSVWDSNVVLRGCSVVVSNR